MMHRDPRHRATRKAARPRVGVFALVAAVAFLPAWATANPLDLYGLGARGTAMGGAMSALASDYSALYYNVAGMAGAKSSLGIGLTLGLDDVRIRLKPRPQGYDLADLGPGSARVPTKYRVNPRSNTDDLPDTYGFHIGATGRLGFDELRVGIAAWLPMNAVGTQRSHFADEREQYFANQLHFELIGERAQQQVIVFGIAWQVNKWLSLGGGFDFLPSSRTVAQVYLDNPTDQSHVLMTVDNVQLGSLAPHVGARIEAGEAMRIAVSFRGANHFGLDLENAVQVRGFQETDDSYPVIQHVAIAVQSTPPEYVLGAAWEGDVLQVGLDLVHIRWSEYLNHQAEPQKNWANTTSIRLGGELRSSAEQVWRAGLSWEPTPVPEQTGRTSYVDNDRVSASVGGGHQMRFFQRDVELGWFVQLQQLLPRDTNKKRLDEQPPCGPGVDVVCDEVADNTTDPATGEPIAAYQGLQTGSPGFPGFQSYGRLIAVGFDLKWAF